MNKEPSAGLSEQVMSSRFRVGGGRVGQQQDISGSPGERVEQEQAGGLGVGQSKPCAGNGEGFPKAREESL